MKLSKRRKGSGSAGKDLQLKNSVAFDKALEMFLDAQVAANHSVATIADYRRVIKLFLRYMSENKAYEYIQQVTETDIIGWLASLRSNPNQRGRSYSSRSIETYERDIAVFFNWLFRHGHLTVNPVASVKSPKIEKALIRVFTDEEVERLDAACERAKKGRSLTEDERMAMTARDRAFLWLLLSTGIRASEACGLLFSDIDWDKRLIYVRGKGAKERRVPFGKVARQHLYTYVTYWRGEAVDADDHVFLNAFGGPLRYSSVREIFTRLKKVSGITDKRVSAHTCRHWFAVNCIKNGMPSTVLQNLLGHEQLKMINTYVRLAEQDSTELYNRYSPADNLKMHHKSRDKRSSFREWRTSRKQGKGN